MEQWNKESNAPAAPAAVSHTNAPHHGARHPVTGLQPDLAEGSKPSSKTKQHTSFSTSMFYYLMQAFFEYTKSIPCQTLSLRYFC